MWSRSNTAFSTTQERETQLSIYLPVWGIKTVNSAISTENREDNDTLNFHLKVNIKFDVKPTQPRKEAKL